MLVIICLVVAALIGASIIVIGLRFLLTPAASAAAFGVPSDRGNAYLSVKGVRDIASGLIVAALLIAGDSHTVGWFLLVASVIPIGDALIVLRANGPRGLAYGMHGGTALAMIAAGVCLVLS